VHEIKQRPPGHRPQAGEALQPPGQRPDRALPADRRGAEAAALALLHRRGGRVPRERHCVLIGLNGDDIRRTAIEARKRSPSGAGLLPAVPVRGSTSRSRSRKAQLTNKTGRCRRLSTSAAARGRPMEVTRVRITDAGRRAIAWRASSPAMAQLIPQARANWRVDRGRLHVLTDGRPRCSGRSPA
jgi:hypothetical protein